ncbi:MAG: DUF3137 domain-containing protein, partial [Burkholderiales bacterium]
MHSFHLVQDRGSDPSSRSQGGADGLYSRTMTMQSAREFAGKATPEAQIGRVVFTAYLGLAAIAWIGIAVAANARTPGLIGFATSIFGGFFVALLIAAIGGGIALKLSEPRAARRAPAMPGDEPNGEMRAILGDLEGYRQDIYQQVVERSAWRIPACAGVGLCVWTLLALVGAPGGALDFVLVMIFGGLVGYIWSIHEQTREYSKVYRERVMPRLAASFGEITWRDAVMPDLARLKAEHVFQSYGEVRATNELAGTYRGLPINIVELKLMSPDEKQKEPVFDGLLIDIDLRRDTGATTAALSEAGSRGLAPVDGKQRVEIAQPGFEQAYDVYSTDPEAARALLSPALTDRLLKLGERGDFGRPTLLCSGSRLTVAAPKVEGRPLFEPPSFTKPDDNRETLLKLRGDIEA